MEIKLPSPDVIKAHKDKTVCIFHNNKTVRNMISRTLSEVFHISQQMITMLGGTHDDAIEELSKAKYDIVIAPLIVDEQYCVDLLKKHEEYQPNRLNSYFIIVAEENSMSAASIQLEHPIDAFLTIPLTQQSVTNTLVELFEERCNPSKDFKSFHIAKKIMLESDPVSAIDAFKKQIPKMEEPAHAYAMLGQLYAEVGDYKNAYESYQAGLETCVDNYLCLAGTMDAFMKQRDYEEAYKYAYHLLQNYPLNITRIPSLIKICIACKKYDDILEILNLFKKTKFNSQFINSYLSAALIVSSKIIFAEGKVDAALETVQRAIELDPKNKKILEQGCVILASNKLLKQAIELLQKHSGEHFTSTEFIGLKMNTYYHAGEFDEVFKASREQKNGFYHTPYYHEILIHTAVKSKCNESQIEAIIEAATKAFPNEEKLFLSIAKKVV